MSERKPLSAELKNGEIVIRIGVDILAHAVAGGNDFHEYDEKAGDYIRSVVISDTDAFAKDVLQMLLAEDERGEGPLSRMFDEACRGAIDDGSIGCEYGQRIKFGEFHKKEKWAEQKGGQQE